jgi:hypothetical protein
MARFRSDHWPSNQSESWEYWWGGGDSLDPNQKPNVSSSAVHRTPSVVGSLV